MDQRQALRVLIVGQPNSFNRVLATNIRRWGYEVAELSLLNAAVYQDRGGERNRLQGDIMLYDIDESFRVAKLLAGKDTSVLPLPMIEGAGEDEEACRPQARFVIALSNHSISRATLDEIGAVALIHKQLAVRRLPRYLQVLGRLMIKSDEEAVPAAPSPKEERTRVLIVDDDIDIAKAVRQCLTEEADYEVVVAHDGIEALEQYVEWHPQCIVTDLIMPWMDGYQVIHCLDKSPLRKMPAFVMMSALTHILVPESRPYLENKVIMYMEKPFYIEQLLQTIEQALHRVTAAGSRPLA